MQPEPVAADLPGGSFPMARGSAVRFLAEGTWALLSLVTGAIVAQELQADGKGVTASIGYLVALVAPLCCLGLGEATVTFVRQRRVETRDAVRWATGAILLTTTAGMGLLVVVARLQFGGDLFGRLNGSVLAAALTVPFFACWLTFSLLAESQGRMVETSAVKVAVGLTITIATVVLVPVLHRGVAGAIAASGSGFVVGTGLLVVVLSRAGAPPRPALNLDYTRAAARFGLPIQLAALLVGLSSRVDLLLVQLLRSGTQAGYYSVALTLSQLAAYGSVALSTASFPVIAGETQPLPLIERVTRTAIMVGLVTAAALAVVLPVGIPLVFGHEFEASVTLTYILLPGGVIYGAQWALCRGWAAHGDTSMLMHSFLASSVVMLIGDVALIPPFGNTGAAVASVAGSALGLVVGLEAHRRKGGSGPASLLRPTGEDLRSVVALLRR